MKKYFLTAAALLLLSPLTASAELVDTGYMQMTGGGTAVHTSLGYWYTDYDVTVANYDGPALESYEAFCTENAAMSHDLIPYAFYTIDDKLNTNFNTDADYLNRLTEATWIASWALKAGTQDAKTTAQLAIWNVMFDATINSYYKTEADFWNPKISSIRNAYAVAMTNETNDDYINQWLLAVSPTTLNADGEIQIGLNAQNFLVHAPVPEPGTMLLFGTGLAGLAAVSRRRRS